MHTHVRTHAENLNLTRPCELYGSEGMVQEYWGKTQVTNSAWFYYSEMTPETPD